MIKDFNKWLLCGVAASALASATAFAQQTPPATAAAPADDSVVVVGTRIKGAKVTAALPVVVVDEEQIAATGATSGDDLMRSIPQMGDVLFDAANNPQTSNSARGDVNSVNLRSLGVGNTLVLLNGRRLVQHPTSQGTSDTGTVPVQSFNSNAVPVAGLQRMEVLLDGAAAIYGADAVAGVVNTVLKDNYDGLTVELQHGGAEGTSLTESELNLYAGKNFAKGNLSVFVNYADRSMLMAEDQNYTRTDDLRSLFAEYPGYASSLVPDGRSSHSPWAQLAIPATTTALRPRQGTTVLTTAAGAFHYQPSSFGCAGATVGNDICLVSGTVAYSGVNRDMRYDTRYGTSVRPSVERLNVYATGHYEIAPNLTAFGEVGFYAAESRAIQPPVVNLNALWIPATNYWNPFGPVTFANGTTNPNRLANLVNVPTSGLAVRLANYRFADAGFQNVTVKNFQSRVVAGLRGKWAGFDWETAFVYSEAEAEDISPNINMTKLQQQLALSTPDAYNPFSGGCVATPSYADCSPSSSATINAIVFDMRRFSRTTLTMLDYKMTRRDLFTLPAGQVGVALGAEVRRETQYDDRDANLDGTYTFTDMVSGEKNLSNVSAVSPNPDTRGKRTVSAAYVEFAVPVISPEMGIPLVRSIDLQLAARYENYSDFGSVTKPKVAMAWDVIDGLRLRGSYSEGFRAPNLEQVNATQYARSASGNDYIRCEADLRAGRIASMNACSRAISGSLLISGNPDLKPEESTNQSVGVVFQPQFIPASWGSFTFTADRWKIEQEQIVGLLGAQSALALDYLLRMSGSSNPNVVRAAVNSDDETIYAGTGLAAVGQVTSIKDQFINLLPQTVEGLDFGFTWQKRRTEWGSFTFRANASQLLKFKREPGDIVDLLYAARAAGTINTLTPLPDSSQLIAQNGRPEWKISTSFTWSKGNWRSGLSTQYVSEVNQTGLLSDTGVAWVVKSQLLTNLYVQYEFEKAGLASNSKVRLGVRDLFDEGPSLADGGYLGSVQRPYGRYWYVNVSKTF